MSTNAPARRVWSAPLLSALFLIACEATPPDPIEEAPPTTGGITVAVRLENDPLEGAFVAVYPSAGGTPVGHGASLPNGTRHFGSIEPGQYQVHVTAPAGSTGGGVRNAEVVAGLVTRVDFSLVAAPPQPAGRGNIHVRVLVDSVAPLAGATVRLYHPTRLDQPRRSAATDADGWVLFDSLAPGTWFLAVDLPAGYEMMPDPDNHGEAINEEWTSTSANRTAVTVFHATETD